MEALSVHEQNVLTKIRQLPLPQQAQVEDFIDFLQQRQSDRGLVLAAMQTSRSSFERIWDNPEDAVYDNL